MPAKGGSAKKDKDRDPPFSAAGPDWTRAVFDLARLSGKGVGGSGGSVPRIAISHGTMRRLRLAVGEEVLLLPRTVPAASSAPARPRLMVGQKR